MNDFMMDIIGHTNIKTFLKKLIFLFNRPQSYLFYGQKSLGKQFCVLKYIKSIMCIDKRRYEKSTNLSEVLCGVCEHCTLKNHPDIKIIQREIDDKTGHLKKNISIEQIRELKDSLQKGSFLNGYNCGVILDAQSLSESASNSLLKLLEEPSKNSMIFLIADSLSYLPKTVISRCQLLRFSPVPEKKIFDFLKNKIQDEFLIKEIIKFSNGSPGIAINLLNNIEELREKRNFAQDLVNFVNMKKYERFKFIEDKLENYKGNQAQVEYLKNFIYMFNSVLRDFLLVSCDVDEQYKIHLGNDFLNLGIKNLFSPFKIKSLINQNNEFLKITKTNVNPQLILENILLSL